MKEEEGLPAHSLHHARRACRTSADWLKGDGPCGVQSEITAGFEGRELAKECHIQLCSCEFTDFSPVALHTVSRKPSAATPIRQITPTSIPEVLLYHHSLLSLPIFSAGAWTGAVFTTRGWHISCSSSTRLSCSCDD